MLEINFVVGDQKNKKRNLKNTALMKFGEHKIFYTKFYQIKRNWFLKFGI